jgi:hypothetical protein
VLIGILTSAAAHWVERLAGARWLSLITACNISLKAAGFMRGYRPTGLTGGDNNGAGGNRHGSDHIEPRHFSDRKTVPSLARMIRDARADQQVIKRATKALGMVPAVRTPISRGGI